MKLGIQMGVFLRIIQKLLTVIKSVTKLVVCNTQSVHLLTS